MKSAVEPGGLFLLEGYWPEQVDNHTGGPPRREHMYTREWLEQEFAGWEILVLTAYDAEIREGGRTAECRCLSSQRPETGPNLPVAIFWSTGRCTSQAAVR